MTKDAATIGMSMAENGPPPQAPAMLYRGQIMHHRMKPKVHRFTYDVFSLMVDLDRLDQVDRLSPLLSVNRFNLLSFNEIDHLPDAGGSLRAHADQMLAKAGLTERAARVLLVCYPRVFGLVFNPLSVYYAYDVDNRLTGMIYEVRNTFGGRHSYVCPVVDGEMSAAGLKQEADKIFHVSPFVAMNMRYHFRMLPPGRSIRWRILETDPEGPILSATFSGQAVPVTSGSILRILAAIPFLTGKVIAGIHWEALKLWVKGITFIPSPKGPDGEFSPLSRELPKT